MKVLYLVRHAQARGATSGDDDLHRPLTPGGRDDADELGRRFATLEIRPDRLLSSPATRAAHTAQRIAEALGRPHGAVEVVEGLYDAPTESVLAIVRSLDDASDCVAVVAHNPAIGEFAQALSASIAGFAPGAMAAFRIETAHWRDVGVAPVRDAWMQSPGGARRAC